MSKNFYHLAQRIFNVPVAILPQKSEIIVSALASRLGIASISMIGAMPPVRAMDDWDAGDSYGAATEYADSDYDVVESVAVIAIHDTLVQKTGNLRPSSGMTGYDGIRQNFLEALGNPKIKAIVLDIDSPGGEVAGCFDLVDTIYESRGTKPILAILNESAYSAAYALASAADYITVPRTGGAGSIGTICMHIDMSAAIAEAGMKVTMIQYGDKKTWGTDTAPLATEAQKEMQARIDAMGELFVATVARNRTLDPQIIRDTQAGCYNGQDAVDIGLVDEVLSPHLAFTNLVDTIT